MEKHIYNLKFNDENSKEFYETTKFISKIVLNQSVNISNNIINDYMKYIKDNKIENLRTFKEYYIEITLIGVLIKEYKDNVESYNPINYPIFFFLNKIRNISKSKKNIDKIRGRLIYKVLSRKSLCYGVTNLSKFRRTILYLKSTNDFKEEIIRIEQWGKFLKGKSNGYVNDFFITSNKLSEIIYENGDKYLKKYLLNVENYLNSYEKDHINKEDYIYCGKGIIQYYFNIISSEIMNSVYIDDFLKIKEKYIFLPSCMRNNISKCKGKTTNTGILCRNCDVNCNISKLNKKFNSNKVQIYIIPHENILLKNNKEINKRGVIGIACITNLISGGFKAIRLGFIPQCVILDYCGCSNHWYKNHIMTDINSNILLEKLN